MSLKSTSHKYCQDSTTARSISSVFDLKIKHSTCVHEGSLRILWLPPISPKKCKTATPNGISGKKKDKWMDACLLERFVPNGQRQPASCSLSLTFEALLPPSGEGLYCFRLCQQQLDGQKHELDMLGFLVSHACFKYYSSCSACSQPHS